MTLRNSLNKQKCENPKICQVPSILRHILAIGTMILGYIHPFFVIGMQRTKQQDFQTI